MSMRSSDAPASPPPPPPRSPRPSDAGTWEQTVDALDGRIDHRKAETKALAADVARLKTDIGHPPNSVTGDRGSGIWGAIGTVLSRVDHVDATLTRILARLDAFEAASARRGGWVATRGEKVLDALLVAAMLTLAAATLRKLGLW